MKSSSILLLLLLFVGTAQAQNTVSTSLKGLHDITANNIMATAEMLDQDIYAYQPTEDVRTAGQILAHIANAQFAFCSAAAGQDSPNSTNYEEEATTKAEVIDALSTAFGYCAGVYEEMSDEEGAEMRNLFGMNMAASAVLAFNSAHNYEHYGNLVTYMRLNDIVPPSSQ